MMMIGIFVGFVLLPAVSFAVAAFCAPVAVEGPCGLRVLEPGRRIQDLLPGCTDRVDPLAFWGLG